MYNLQILIFLGKIEGSICHQDSEECVYNLINKLCLCSSIQLKMLHLGN